MNETLTGEALRRTIFNANVYTILAEECGAERDEFIGFDIHWPECREYRFIGNQGFGGKIWAGRPPYVTCYIEDENPERNAARARANSRLARLSY